MQTQFHGVIFTNHAIQRLYQRRIAQSDAWHTLRHPDGSLKGKTPGSWKFYKNYGSQRIEIVAKQNEKREWIVLSCWSKFVGTGKPYFPYKESLPEKLIKKGLEKLENWIRKKRKKA